MGKLCAKNDFQSVIQQLVDPPLAAGTLSGGFRASSTSHGCGGIFAHSPFHRCFSSLRFADGYFSSALIIRTVYRGQFPISIQT